MAIYAFRKDQDEMKKFVIFWTMVCLVVALLHQVESNSLERDYERDSAATEPDWEEICRDLCRKHEGGALCNCEMPVVFDRR